MSWPRLDTCPRCGDQVLKARGATENAQGRPYVLELDEVFPEGRCPYCRAHGRLAGNVPCARCNGTGRRGEPLRPDMVLLANDGRARPLILREGREPGEAAHRRHRCANALEQAA